MPAGAVSPGDDTETGAARVWQSSPPGSLYDYIRVASFSLDRQGRIDQWSRRAEAFFGLSAAEVLGRDPVAAFAPPEVRDRAHERLAEILDGREWTGVVPYDSAGRRGLAEVYVMPADHGALCVAVDVAGLRQIETDLAASQAVFGQSPMGFVLFDTKLRLIRVNERFAEVFGRPADGHRGRGPHDFLSRVEADRLTAALRQVLETGDPVLDMPLIGTVPGAPGRRRWSMSLYRLHSHGGVTRDGRQAPGRPIGVAGLAMDVTGRQRAEREAAHVRRNLQLLNEAGSRIGTSLDLETTARELLDVAVPHFCDLASVDLYQVLLAGAEDLIGATDGSGEVRRVAFASAVSDAPVVMPGDDDRLPGSGPVSVGAVHRYRFGSAAARALRTAQSQVLDGDGAGDLGGALVQSTLVVPMVARDTVLGLVQFSRAKGSEPFTERDRVLAEELAARAAIFLDNARLYRREHERALILQRSLLPPDDPEATGLDIACRYLPGSMETEVGGDWFDVIELPGHRTALVVGDVMGRGLRAAVAMGELRTAVRTLAMLDLEPAEVLSALDEVASGLGKPVSGRAGRGKEGDADLGEVYLATCVYVVYDAVTRRITVANAGHLPPVVVEPGEDPLLLEVPRGVPLGVGGEPFEEVEVPLAEGALLALYTDGLVESRNHPLDEGLDAFRAALAGPPRPLEDVCDRVLATLDTAHGEDDIALLTARIRGLPGDKVGDWTLQPHASSVARARELAREQLLTWGLDSLVDTTELLVSELVTNALRHGYGDIRLRLLLDHTLVCEVWDSALMQPRRRRARDTDEGGRGLQLVAMLSQSWGSRRTHRGKTVWFELALRAGRPGSPGPSVDDLLSLF